jgi:hypothetical protein
LGTNASEGHGYEQDDEIGLADQVAKFHEFRAIGAFANKGEVWGFVADLKCHDLFEVVAFLNEGEA